MTTEDRIARGARAEQAMDEFLGPAFAYVVAQYLEKLETLASEQPWETDKIRKLAAATKIAKTVQAQIVAYVMDGDAAYKEKHASDKIANMNDSKRKWALMAGGMR